MMKHSIQSALERIRLAFPPMKRAPSVPHKSPLWMYGSVCVAFFLLALLTRPTFFGDTYWYVGDIYGTLQGDQRASARIWDFGHLFWRPLGLASARLLLPLMRGFAEFSERAGITMILVAMNGIATLVCAFGICSWAWRITGRPLISSAAAVFFLATNVVLSFSRAGAPCVPGLACITTASLIMASIRGSRPLYAACAGVLAACAVLLWLPYAVTVPAVLSALYVAQDDDRLLARRILLSVIPFCAGVVLTIALGYGFAAWQRDVASWSDVTRWYMQGSHREVQQNRNLIRAFSGLPRSFINMGEDAILLKRFVFKDPYAQVTFAEIIRASVARVALVFISMAVLCFSLWNSLRPRRLLALLAVAFISNVAFAALFESGSPDRYLPFYPFLFVALAAVMHLKWPGRLLAGACSAMLVFNVFAVSTGAVAATRARQMARIRSLSQARSSDLAYVLNIQDPLVADRYSVPFNAGIDALPVLEPILPFAGKEVPRWRAKFAEDVLAAWQKGARVWVTDRVLFAIPRREWNWVEGDDPRISWREIHALFATLDLKPSLGGPDGFLLLVESGRNRAVLQNLPSAPASVGFSTRQRRRASKTPRELVENSGTAAGSRSSVTAG